jgi:hypothetical protein
VGRDSARAVRQGLNWQTLQMTEKMERETGFEPATSSLGSWHSTTELLPPVPAAQPSGLRDRPIGIRENSYSTTAAEMQASTRAIDGAAQLFRVWLEGWGKCQGRKVWKRAPGSEVS